MALAPLRSATVTRQPSDANALATAQPMPDAPPMTSAVRSVRFSVTGASTSSSN
jgi:hypothetical protein